MIATRREQMKDPEFVNKGDFLTMMIEDELFKSTEEYIIDECITMMLAGTATTTLLLSNAVYHLTKCSDKREKLRAEIAKYNNN